MSQHQSEITGIHKAPLYGALAVVVFALVLVIGAVWTKDETKDAATLKPVSERHLYFLDGNNGEVVVYDAVSREKIAAFEKGEGAFVRISMRSLMRQRKLKEIDFKQPFLLVQTEDGNLSITDPQSGDKIRVNAFGQNAIESFARFLPTDYSTKGAEG